jgi:hypothetical protein
VLGARYDSLSPLGAHLFLSLPISDTTLEDADASADIDARIVGASFGIELLPDHASFRLYTGLGGGAVWLRARGKAAPPLSARSVDETTGLAFAEARVSLLVGDPLRLTLGVLAGAAIPRTDIAFADRRVGTWGRPIVSGSLSIGYDP